MTDRLTRYAPAAAALCILSTIGLCGAIGYARKAGQVETRDPIVATALPATPTEPPTIGYFDPYNDRTAVAFRQSDIIGEVGALPGWRLVLLRGGGRVWLQEGQP